MIGLTTSAALEYAPRGIRINAICPGTIETPMVADMIAKGELDRAEAAAATPIGRLGRLGDCRIRPLAVQPRRQFRRRRRPPHRWRLHRPMIEDQGVNIKDPSPPARPVDRHVSVRGNSG